MCVDEPLFGKLCLLSNWLYKCLMCVNHWNLELCRIKGMGNIENLHNFIITFIFLLLLSLRLFKTFLSSFWPPVISLYYFLVFILASSNITLLLSCSHSFYFLVLGLALNNIILLLSLSLFSCLHSDLQ